MSSDILLTGFECGVLNGKVQPGNSVAIVASGPIELVELLIAQFYTPAATIMIDRMIIGLMLQKNLMQHTLPLKTSTSTV